MAASGATYDRYNPPTLERSWAITCHSCCGCSKMFRTRSVRLINASWLLRGGSASDSQQTLDAGHGVTAKPDRDVVEADGDPAVTAETPALTGDIGARLQHAVAPHERGDAPVAASAHRILGDPVARRERAYLEVGAAARGVEAEHVDPRDADRVQRRELPHMGRERPDGIAAHELRREPHGPDVDDRRALDVGRADAETVRDRRDLRRGGLAEFRLGQREEQALTVDLDVDEPLAALLHQPVGRPGFEAMAQRGVGRADRGVAGER